MRVSTFIWVHNRHLCLYLLWCNPFCSAWADFRVRCSMHCSLHRIPSCLSNNCCHSGRPSNPKPEWSIHASDAVFASEKESRKNLRCVRKERPQPAMVYFCPHCCNMLHTGTLCVVRVVSRSSSALAIVMRMQSPLKDSHPVEYGPNERFRFFCKTCPYVFNIEHKITKKVSLQRKEVDAVLGESAYENADQTEGLLLLCPCHTPASLSASANFVL
jgi:hypothetical protein